MGRAFAGLVALLAWTALILQFVLMVIGPEFYVVGAGESVARYFSFFTVLTNIIVAVTTSAIAFSSASFFSKPTVQAAVATYITIVGLVYSLFLRAVWDPVGLNAVADHLLHDAVPLGYVLYWLIFAPKAGIAWTSPFKWLAYPVAYVAYSLARGAAVDWYPYWFVDVTTMGYPQALTNTAFVLAAFLVVGVAFTAIARILSARTRSRSVDIQ